MRIEPFDVWDEAAGAAYAALVAQTRRCVTPLGETLPAAYVLNRLRRGSPDSVLSIWLGWEDDRLVGAAESYWKDAPDNRDRAWVHLDVLPGSAIAPLARTVASHCLDNGRPVLTVEAEQGSPLAAWVAATGATFGGLDEQNVLDLASVSRDDLVALATAPEGYQALLWDAFAPDDLLPAFAALVSGINDAPQGGLTTAPGVWTPERIRRWEQGAADRGHPLWTVVAREVATGELAAYNQLELRPEWPEVVQNQDTVVARPHRGRGLGVWIKAVNLLRVLDEWPAGRCVDTWNHATNEHMLRVNRRLGFVRQHVVEQWEARAEALCG